MRTVIDWNRPLLLPARPGKVPMDGGIHTARPAWQSSHRRGWVITRRCALSPRRWGIIARRLPSGTCGSLALGACENGRSLLRPFSHAFGPRGRKDRELLFFFEKKGLSGLADSLRKCYTCSVIKIENRIKRKRQELQFPPPHPQQEKPTFSLMAFVVIQKV